MKCSEIQHWRRFLHGKWWGHAERTQCWWNIQICTNCNSYKTTWGKWKDFCEESKQTRLELGKFLFANVPSNGSVLQWKWTFISKRTPHSISSVLITFPLSYRTSTHLPCTLDILLSECVSWLSACNTPSLQQLVYPTLPPGSPAINRSFYPNLRLIHGKWRGINESCGWNENCPSKFHHRNYENP